MMMMMMMIQLTAQKVRIAAEDGADEAGGGLNKDS
jgi:hypothetical protein